VLLSNAGANVNAAIQNGWTALHLAAMHGRTAVVQLLLGAQVAVDAADDAGWAALHWAAYGGYTAAVQLLLDAHAAVDAVAKDSTTSLHWSGMGGHTAVVRCCSRQQQSLMQLMLMAGQPCTGQPTQAAHQLCSFCWMPRLEWMLPLQMGLHPCKWLPKSVTQQL
jgi:ankyrin repeat protein